jgi:hypothetical protein
MRHQLSKYVQATQRIDNEITYRRDDPATCIRWAA